MPRKGANEDPQLPAQSWGLGKVQGPPSTKEPVFLESESRQEGISGTSSARTPFCRLGNRPVGGEPGPGILDSPGLSPRL